MSMLHTKASKHAEKTVSAGKRGKEAEKRSKKKGVLDKGGALVGLCAGIAIYQGHQENKINKLNDELHRGYDELQNAERYSGNHHQQSFGDIYARVKLDMKKEEIAKRQRKLQKIQKLTNGVFQGVGRAMGGLERAQRTMLQKQTYDAVVQGDVSGASRDKMVAFDTYDNMVDGFNASHDCDDEFC